MPFSDPAQHLRDILENIDHVERVLSGVTLENYAAERDISALTERYLQIITEAAYRLREDAEAVCPGPNWKGWRDLGNILRHAYDRVDVDLVWEAVTVDLPALKASVKACLERLSRNPAVS